MSRHRRSPRWFERADEVEPAGDLARAKELRKAGRWALLFFSLGLVVRAILWLCS